MRTRKITVFVFLVAMFAAQTLFSQSQFKFKQVIQNGDNAPVPPQLGSVGEFAFNDLGQVALVADGGLLLKSGDTIVPIAAPADAAPDGGAFFTFSNLSVGPQGQVAFTARGSFPNLLDAAFIYANGNITQLFPGGMQANTGELVIPRAAQFAHNGDMLVTDAFTSAIYLFSNNTLTRVAGPGDPLPGGVTIQGGLILQAALNSSRQVEFDAVGSDGHEALFLWSNGTVTHIITNFSFLPDGRFFFSFSSPSINDLGQVVFAGFSDSQLESGIFSYFQGRLSVPISQFTVLPGGFTAFVFDPSINNRGQIAFAGIDTFNHAGIFLFTRGQITTVELQGQTAPDGGVFRSGVQQFGGLVNASGQMLFVASEVQHGSALYLSTGNQISRVIGQGDTIPVQPRFAFPVATAIGAGDTVLLTASTFPGGFGAYTAKAPHGAAPGRANLIVHEGEPIGADGIVDSLFGFNLGFSMNHSGDVVATGSSSDAGGIVLLNDKTSLSVVADSSPTSEVNPNFGLAVINNLGEVAFNGFDPSTQASGIFLNSGGQTQLLLSADTLLPTGGTLGTNITNLALNDQDQIAFMAQPDSGPIGVFTAANGIVTSLAADGALAPGGGIFQLFFGLSNPVINDRGDIVFSSFVNFVPGGFAGFGIFLYKDGTLSRVIGPGDPSPGGGVFFFADEHSMNSAGDIAFSGVTTDLPGFGIFVYSHGRISQVAAAGDIINNIVLLPDEPVINDNGHIAFTSFSGGQGNVIFLAAPQSENNPNLADWVIPTHGVAPTLETINAFKAQKAARAAGASGCPTRAVGAVCLNDPNLQTQLQRFLTNAGSSQ